MGCFMGGILWVASWEESSRSHHRRIPPGSYILSESGGFFPGHHILEGFLHSATYPEFSSGFATYGVKVSKVGANMRQSLSYKLTI